MFPLFALPIRRTGSLGLLAAWVFVTTVWVGTAVAQDSVPERPRMPASKKQPDMEQIEQLFEDALREAEGRGGFGNAFGAKKSTKAMEEAGNGVLAVVIIGVGLIGLLVGFYVLRRMAAGANTRRYSALDDPALRAYMLALEGQKPDGGSQKAAGGCQKTEIGGMKAETGSQKIRIGG